MTRSGQALQKRTDMKAFFLFTPAFLEWSLAICRELHAAKPDTSISGLVTGPQHVLQRVACSTGVGAAQLHRLDDLERRWIATPARPSACAAYEAMLGEDIFSHLTIADRHLGRGFISGGETVASALATLAEDPKLRERYLVGLLDFAFNTLDACRPEFIFCHTVDTAPALALALAAQNLDIPFAQLRHTRIGNRVIIDTVPYDHLDPVRKLFEHYVMTKAMPVSAARSAEAYLARLRSIGTTPDYLAYHSRRVQDGLRSGQLLRTLLGGLRAALRESLSGERRALRRPAPLAVCRHQVQVSLRTASLLRRAPFRPAGWRPSGPFAFYPLHVDPEASTMVQSPQHTDQLAVAEAIAKSLPCGMSLVIKEHLPMLGRRPGNFYARLRRLPGVELCSPFEQGADLVRDASLTTVISSTAGWEAIVLGRPTLVIAFPPYAMLNDGFVAEPELARLGAAIRAALAGPPASERRLVAYVAAALECSFACPTEVVWGEVTGETIRQNPEILAQIVAHLQAVARPDPVHLSLSS